jgi:hypothetical protein
MPPPGEAQGPNIQVDAWIHGWAAQVSELLGYFSREIARLVERVEQAEQKLNAAAEASAEQLNFKQLEAVTFTEALKMEREARMYETAQLRAALDNAGPCRTPNGSIAHVAESLAEAAGAECDKFAKVAGSEWKEFSERASSLSKRLSAELSEQHALVTRDIVEQRTKAIQAFIAEQSSEVVEIQKRLRREVAEIASEAAEEVLDQQDRERQCAELRIALQEAAEDGCMPSTRVGIRGSKRESQACTSNVRSDLAPSISGVVAAGSPTAALVAAAEDAAGDSGEIPLSKCAPDVPSIPAAASQACMESNKPEIRSYDQRLSSSEVGSVSTASSFPATASSTTVMSAAPPATGTVGQGGSVRSSLRMQTAYPFPGTNSSMPLRTENTIRGTGDRFEFMGSLDGVRAAWHGAPIHRVSSFGTFSDRQSHQEATRRIGSPERRATSPIRASTMLPPPSMAFPSK